VALANATDPPLTHSLSYGENEAAYSPEYEARMNVELLKLGLRGLSLFVATGDTGVQGAAQPGGAPPKCAPFQPTFPATSPYVTSVGGTQFSDHTTEVCNAAEVFALGTQSSSPFACPEEDVGEIVCSTQTGAMITGGGGFSDRFARPQYQADAVQGYLETLGRRGLLPSAGMFNRSGRAYPDIAAIGQNVPTVFNGSLAMAGGTSAAAPIAAALFSLLNAEQLAKGRPPLGFVNPWLYSTHAAHPEVLNDVRVGNISGGNRLLPKYVDCDESFVALPGWDAASGLGSPDFTRLLNHLPLAPQPPPPPPPPPPATCVASFGGCDPEAGGAPCCEAGERCYTQSIHFSQCLTACPSSPTWKCSNGSSA